MDTDIRRELRILKGYAVVVTALLGTLSLAAFRQGAQNAQAGAAQKTKFTEIDVERINIVEPDGKLRMVISNRPRSIGPIYKGTPFGYPGGTRPGIIFFNDEGTENGGLTFTGAAGRTGSTARRAASRSTSSTRTRSSTSSTPTTTAPAGRGSRSPTAPTWTSSTSSSSATRSTSSPPGRRRTRRSAR